MKSAYSLPTGQIDVAQQPVEIVKPIGISPEQANHLRALVDEKTKQDGELVETTSGRMAEQIATVEEKLNKLTRGYLDELIDEESYQAAKADLVIAKAELKRSKEQLHRNRSSFWNEPAKEVINTLELAGKSQTTKSPQELSLVVHKVGTNRLLSRKTVTFSFSEPYAFIPSLSASSHVTTSNTSPSLGDETGGSIIWCAREDLNL